MAEYLSSQWIASVNAAMNSDVDLTRLCAEADLTLQQEVYDGPGGDVIFHVTLEPSGASISEGPAARADVTLRQTHTTALAIKDSEMNALDGVQTGAIELSGDVARLAAHREALAQLQLSFRAGDSSNPPSDRNQALK